MTDEEPSWRKEMDRAISKRNKLVREESELTEQYNELQIRREKLQTEVEGGDQRPQFLGLSFGRDQLSRKYRELVSVRDRIAEVTAETIRVRHDIRDATYTVEFVRSKLQFDKQGVL